MTMSRNPKRTWSVLVPSLALVLLLAAQGTVASSAQPIYVLVTIDVESRRQGGLEQNIWGELPGEAEKHGITRMMDILDRHGMKGTFFVNVYEAPWHREGAMAEVCRTIHKRGHDVELHTHPAPMFGVFYMQYADLPTQTEILRRGARLLKEWTGVEPVAHRAGGHMANLDTLEACREAGIPLDFSYNIAWPASSLSSAGLTQNAPFVREGVLCVPDTAYQQVGVGSWQSLRILDIEASSPEEIRKVIADLRQHGVRAATILMHSFSFSRSGKPNLRVERVFEDLAAGFAADPSVQVVTARQLHDIWRANPGALQGGDYLPTTGWWMTYCRAWQRLDEGAMNGIVAVGPVVAVGLLGVVGGVLWRRRRHTHGPVGSADRKANEIQFWANQVARGDRLRRHFYDEVNDCLWDLILSQLGDVRDRRILLVGCGTSSVVVKWLAAQGAEVYAVDISPASVAQLMKHPFAGLEARIRPVVADAEQEPFADGVFDIVLGKAIVHHLDIERFLGEVERVSAAGALLVFSEPLGTNPLINLFRWLTPGARVPTEHPLRPGDVREVRRRCESAQEYYSFFLALAAMPCFSLRLDRLGRAVFGAGRRLDRAAFCLCPPLRWLAWNVTLVGRLGPPRGECPHE